MVLDMKPTMSLGKELPGSYFNTISKIREDFFLKKVLNILDSLDCHFYTKLLIQYTEV